MNARQWYYQRPACVNCGRPVFYWHDKVMKEDGARHKDCLAAALEELKKADEKIHDLGKSYGMALDGQDTQRTRAEAAEQRVAELEEGIRAIDNAVAIQCSDGNWNYDPYMHGMANGLLLAQTYMAHPTGAYDAEHYKPLSAPERWLSDVAPTPPPAATE